MLNIFTVEVFIENSWDLVLAMTDKDGAIKKAYHENNNPRWMLVKEWENGTCISQWEYEYGKEC